MLFFLAIELGSDPALTIPRSQLDQHVLVVIMQARLAHFFHRRYPEFVVKEQLNTLLLVRHLAESVSRELSVLSIVENLGCRTEGHWWSLLFENLGDLRPVKLLSVALDCVGEVKLLVQLQ